jgi:adenine deaminase
LPLLCLSPRRVVELEELADFAVAEFMEVGLWRFKDFPGVFVFEGDVAKGGHPIALGDVFDDQDMARCANVLLEAGGGMVIVNRGEILEKIEFPFGGIFSLNPWQEVGSELRRIQTRLREMGSSFDKPIFALSFLPFVTLPALRITARGLIDAKERKIVPLFAD